MGSDIGVKMGVTGIAQFKQAMNQANQSVKTLDAELKLNEKQYKANGDAEAYMEKKSKLLQQQIASQNKVVKEGKNALEAMKKNGVDEASKAYQQMQQKVLNAQAALLDMNGELNSVGQSAEETAQKTDNLTDSLNGINKKVSFDAVLGGIGKITDGMEAAARKVESLARDVWDTMAMAASWADNENTLAAMYGIDVETLQRMQGASRTIDTSVETIIKSQQKLKQNMVYGSDDVNEAFRKLGVSIGYVTGKGNEIQVFRDSTDVFWEAGEALKTYADEVERDAMAQKIFGSSWRELLPLFTAGREAYEKTLSEQSIVTEENVNKLNQLDDALQKLDQDYKATKNTILSELAPAFTEVAGGLSNLIGQVNEYLQTDEGKEKLEALGQAVTDLFTGITDVDFGNAIDTVGGILDSITSALGWIKDNHTAVENALKGIGGAFLAMKVAEVVGTLTQAANGLKGLLGGGSAASGAGSSALSTAAGAATGASLTTLVKSAFGGASKFVSAIGSKLGLTGLGLLIGIPMVDFAANPEEYTGSPDAMEKYNELMRLGRQDRTPASDNSVERTVEAIYEDLYKAINDYDPETNIQEKTLFFENVLKPLAAEAMQAGNVPLEEMDGIAALFRQKFLDSFEDDWEGTTGGLLNILQEAIDEKAQGLKVETTPELPADAETILQGELNGMGLTVPVMPGLAERTAEAIYEDLYKSINDYDPDTSSQDTTQFFDNVLYPLIQEAGKASGVVGDDVDAIADLIYDKWIQSLFSDDWEGNTGGILNILQEAIDEAAAEGLTVETTPDLVDNAAELLQDQLSSVSLHVSVVPDMAASIDGSHANGLPFVPFDGYIAVLHKGERVVPAAQSRNYTNTSNIYFDKVNVNNGIDADGLAERIAERTRRAMAGFGG